MRGVWSEIAISVQKKRNSSHKQRELGTLVQESGSLSIVYL